MSRAKYVKQLENIIMADAKIINELTQENFELKAILEEHNEAGSGNKTSIYAS